MRIAVPRIPALVLSLAVFGLAAAACNAGGAPASSHDPVPGRIALLAGASGETEEPNFFIEDLKAYREALVGRGWRVDSVVGSRGGLLPGSVPATNANLARGVRQALEAASPGQEVLLVFHSHGREQETYWGQRSHSIVSEDKDATGGDPGFDLDTLEEGLMAARARGVKAALVDLSCYSGSTQALQGAACVVSLAAARYVSLCSGRPEERHFNAKFFELPPPGTAVSLEEQFLEARRQDRDSINLPQISSIPTPAAAGWEAFLLGVDPLDTFEDLKDFKTGTAAFAPRELLGEVDAWIARQRGRNPGLKDLRSEIAGHLSEALTIRARLEREMPLMAREYDNRTLAVALHGRGAMKLGPAYLAELLGAVRDHKIPVGYTDVQRNLLKAIAPVSGELGARFAGDLTRFQARRDQYDDDTEALARAAGSLFEAERRLYDAQPRPQGTDACRDFAL
jgi:hypothetical protein